MNANETPNAKRQTPGQPQVPNSKRLFGTWGLELLWSLEFGVWSFRRLVATLVASSTLLCAAAEPTPRADCQGFDEAAGVWRNASWRAGMPLGGVGCGKFELLPSAWFGRFTINHNWDLPLWEEPFVPSRGTFFAVNASDGVRRVTRWLRRGWPESELADAEQVRCVESRGTFPFADVAFMDEKLPVRANLRAWSALTPHNIKDSSLPVAFFDVTLENPLARSLQVSVMMSLENFVGIGGVRVHEGKQRWYFADGSSQQPAVISGSMLQGLKFRSPRQFEGIGKNVSGEYLLLTDGPTTDRGWDALGDGKALVEDFRLDGELNGLTVRAKEDKVRPAGALCRKVLLAPRSKETVHFMVVWWMPDHVTLDLKSHGHFCQRDFADPEKLAAYAFEQRERLAKETDAWARLVRESNLPAWMKSLTLNSAAAMFSNTLLTRDGAFAMQENPVRGEGALGALEKRRESAAFCRTFFPELDRRELELFRACQQPNGEVPRLYGNAYRGIGNPNVWRGITGDEEPACVYVAEVLEHYRATGDRKFLDATWPGVKQAMAWLRQAKTPAGASYSQPAASAAAAMARIENEPELAREYEPKAVKQLSSADATASARQNYEVACRYNKNLWGQPASIDSTFDNPPAIHESDVSALAAWTLLPAITGAALDVPERRLMLSPRLPAGMTELHAPVFFARFWAWLDFGPKEFRLKIVQHFGEPLELRELAADAGGGAIKLPESFVARGGASLDLSPWRKHLCKANHESRTAGHEALRWAREGAGTLLWSATASSDEPFPPSDAFDGYRETRWATVTPGRTADWFQLDLREVQQPKRIELETTPGAQLRVEFSTDGTRWQSLAVAQPAGTNGVWGLDWTAGAVRVLKFVLARDMDRQWQIRELRVK
ncbi:MAG: discoidin domain-containing protein [Verrucomicrobia bacterium]|nr:discoidin domain-containing protein [Verrucomicrobiota bacterium]